MTSHSKKISERLAVCTWSLEPNSPQDLIEKLIATGVRRAQLNLEPLRAAPETWGQAAALFEQNGIAIISGMALCVGEDYSTLESIRETGGIAPDATWEQNLKNFAAYAEIAAQLKLSLVTLHAGFLPHKGSDGFEKMLERLRQAAALFAEKSIVLGLETGQESAAELAEFLTELNHPKVRVNFDPANMILYGKGDPVEAVRTLAPWLAQVHIKDATPTQTPGTWGAEVAAGQGAVNWADFLAALDKLPFTGDLVIEREAGSQRVADIITAREFITKFYG